MTLCQSRKKTDHLKYIWIIWGEKNETILPNPDGQKILYVSTPSLLLPPMSFPWAGPWRRKWVCSVIQTMHTELSLLPPSVISPSSQKPFSFLYNYIPFPYSFQVWLISKIFPHFCCLLPWLILVGSVPPSLWGPDMEHGKQIKVWPAGDRDEESPVPPSALWVGRWCGGGAGGGELKWSWETFSLLLIGKKKK